MTAIFKDTLGADTLSELWRSIDWEAAERELMRLQRLIALAAKRRDTLAIRLNQQKLVTSSQAKVLAVRQVSGPTVQPGVDGVQWKTDSEKMVAALSLESDGYKASPMRMVVVHPRGDKKRHIQVPTVYDRAMQALHAYSLDPVAEATGERKSFAFRKGRSMFDVHAYILKAFDIENPPLFLVKADIKSYYASISHGWLLKNIPMDTNVLREFLKAGHISSGEVFPSDDFGIALGSSLSPILGNLVLDGAQDAIYKGLHGRTYDIDYLDGNAIRYADDLLITTRTERSAVRILQILRSFLTVRGLTLSDTKTKILNLSSGFDFLSRHYYYADGIVHSEPSKNAIAKMEQGLRDLIKPYRGGQKTLIERLNKSLVGWANYHKVTKATQAFRHIDAVVKTLLLELCERLHPKVPRAKLIKKYFCQDVDGEYVYALVDKRDVRVYRLVDTVLYHHQPVSTKLNPYLDDDIERESETVTGKYKAVWRRQDGKCHYCGLPILIDQGKQIVPIDGTRPGVPRNLAYVHDYCALGQAEFYDTDDPVQSPFDLHKLLLQLKTHKNPVKRKAFEALTERFRSETRKTFTLTFREIETITGRALCQTARTHRSYWYTTGEARPSHSWLSNGYKIYKLNLEKGSVGFQRTDDRVRGVEIPPEFLKDRLPDRAITEIENFFKYIKTKYAL